MSNLCKHGKKKYQDDYAMFCEECSKESLAELDDKLKAMASKPWKELGKEADDYEKL
jgi:hypothetical protein